MLRAYSVRRRSVGRSGCAIICAAVSLVCRSAFAGTAVSFDRQANGQQESDVYLDGNNQQQTYTWTWPDNADWSQSKLMGTDPAGNPIVLAPSNWSQDTYPDGDYDVSLGSAQVTGDVSVSIDTLGLSGELDILGGHTLTITNGSLVNNGNIVVDWDGSAYAAGLYFASDASITGKGQIVLNNDGGVARLDSSSYTLTIGADQTISGLGTINGTFINNGTIRSTVAGGSIDITGTMTNNNSITADDKGTVTFNGTMTNNASIGVVGNDFPSNLVLTGTINNSSNGLVAVGGNLYLDNVAIDGGMVWALNAGAYVQVDGSSTITNDDFRLGGGSKLDILSGNTLTFGGASTLANDGTITVDSDNNPYGCALDFNSNITITGAGDILLAKGDSVSQFNAVAGATVTLASTQTLHGTGTVNASIINNGTISADVPSASLDVSYYGIENDNLMQANNQSILNIYGITVTNTNGQISASNQSAIVINSSTIDGGSVSATPDSYIQWNTGTMSGAITLSGTQNISSGTATTMNGPTLTNNGKIVINPEQSAYGTALNFDTNVAANGPGAILLNGSGEILLDAATAQINVASGDRLTIQAGQTIDGQGTITGDIDNYGSISANVAGQTLQIADSTAFSNFSTLTASNASNLQLTGITVNNANGQISASNQSAVVISGANISGGSVSATPDSYIQWNSDTMSGAITLSGTQNISSATVTTMTGSTLTNNGKIVIDPEKSIYGTALDFDANVTLNGSGEILLDSTSGTSELNVTPGNILTIQSAQTIDGQGTITGDIINYGTISASVSGQTLQITPGIDLANYATLSARNGANLQLTGPFNNSSTMQATTGSVLTLSSASILNQSTGTFNISGQLVLSGSTIDGGTIDASSAGASLLVTGGASTIQNSSLTLGSGNHLDINASNTLTFDGAMTLTNNGTITVNADNNNYGTALNFNSNITINGTGDIRLTQPGGVSQFNAVSGATITLGSGQTLHGTGAVSAAIINQGTINADVTGKSLDMTSYAVENDNTMEATNQSTLNLTAMTINNANGLITASNQSAVVINGTTVTGGSASTSADSHIDWNNATISGAITFSGTQNIVTASSTLVNSDTLTNNGKIVINSTHDNYGTALNFDADTSLIGTGEILLNGAGGTAQLNVIDGHTLTIGASEMIHGQGQSAGNLVNQGTISSDVVGGSLDLDNANLENDHIIQANNQSVLNINSAAVANSAGQIAASNQSAVLISNSTITAGTLSATSDSHIDWKSDTLIAPITLSGTQNISNATTTTINGSTLTNNGKIIINPEQFNYGTALSFSDDATVDGTGEILLDSATVQLNAINNHTLTIGSGQLVHGQGTINGNLVNDGTIRADAGHGLEVTSPLYNGGHLEMTSGTLILDQGLSGDTVLSQLRSGYDGGAWDGPGISSPLAAAHPGTAVGYTTTGSSYTFAYTWLGDTDLNGSVDYTDLSAISPTGANWQTGDFNYDAKVNADDYSLFFLGAADSSGKNISALLPEPSILVIPAFFLMFRRRRA